ncbi:MAG: HIT domain-containing protein [Patescibacteria group bacterium]
MTEPSVFTRIINGEIPSHKVYEDEHTLAFLDIYAVIKGHTLVIPKNQVEFMWDLDDETYQAVTETVKKVALRLREHMGTKYVAEKVIGVDVPHAHVHLIPFNDTSDVHRANRENADPDHEALAQLAKDLYFE